MLIANPIYDVVFKFLMEDSKSAKILLSALLGHQILELDFLPQETSVENEKKSKKKSKTQEIVENNALTIYRMDFSAKIKTQDGEQQIIIELQKVRLQEDITRFRGYLGKQYVNQDLFFWVTDKRKYKAGIPIFAIYFLGYTLSRYENNPIILIENKVTDRFTKEILDKKEPFVSSLFHEGLIVNIPALKGRRRDDLEKLLSIFDQSNREANFHILNVDENDFSEKEASIIRRLKAASKSKDVRAKMLGEDSLLNSWQNLEEAAEKAEEALAKAEEALEEEKRQKQATQIQLEAAEQTAQKERQEKEVLQNKLALAIQNLASKGFSVSEIAQMLGISEQDAKTILEN